MQVQNPITLSNLSDSLCMFWQLFASVCSHPRSYHEFICFIHLVTCATRGVPVPESTPPQLLDSLMNLEPLEVLVAEREESRSRSGSRRSLSPMVTGGAQSRGRSPEPRTFTAERWAPSRREKRKYACLGIAGEEGFFAPKGCVLLELAPSLPSLPCSFKTWARNLPSDIFQEFCSLVAC